MLISRENKPKFILSKAQVFRAYNSLLDVADIVSYSWKTNPNVGEVLTQEESCFFSVHSINELKQVPYKKNIWFFAMALGTEELDLVFTTYNLTNFVVDNLEDLKILMEYIQRHNKKINLLLRMKLKENSVFTGRHYVFGMKVAEVKEQILALSQLDQIEKIGVHIHRKTQNVSEWNLQDEVAEVLGDEILNKISYLNLGGGLPGKYKNSHDKALISIFDKLKSLKSFLHSKQIQVIIEPGRYIASSSVKLETQIVAISQNTIFVNASIFNGSLDTVVANVKLLIEGELEQGERYMIKGCTPDSSDILRYSVYLKNPKVGDKITFLHCGAYTYQTDFCALDNIETIVVEDF